MSILRKKDNFFQHFKRTYGVGKSLSLLMCNHLGIHPESKVKDVSVMHRQESFKKFTVNKSSLMKHALRKEMENNINKKIKSKTYQGKCFKYHLPTRGQRRRSNARTVRKLFTAFTRRVD